MKTSYTVSHYRPKFMSYADAPPKKPKLIGRIKLVFKSAWAVTLREKGTSFYSSHLIWYERKWRFVFNIGRVCVTSEYLVPDDES